jgi:hypothetical protein
MRKGIKCFVLRRYRTGDKPGTKAGIQRAINEGIVLVNDDGSREESAGEYDAILKVRAAWVHEGEPFCIPIPAAERDDPEALYAPKSQWILACSCESCKSLSSGGKITRFVQLADILIV